MKNLLLCSIAALLLMSCKSSDDSKSGSVVFNTNVENIDTLSAAHPVMWKNLSTIEEGVGHSGKFASKIDSMKPFSIVLEARVGDIAGEIPKEVNFTAYGLALVPGSKAVLVVSASDNIYYKAGSFDTLFTTINQWQEMKMNFKLPENLKKDHTLKAYVWNNGIGELLVDDLTIEFKY